MKRDITMRRVIVMTVAGYAFGIVGLVAARQRLEGDGAVFVVAAAAFMVGSLLANLLLPGDRIPVFGRYHGRFAAANAVVIIVAWLAAYSLTVSLGPGHSAAVLLFVFGPLIFVECLLTRLSLRRGTDASES